MHRRSIGKRGSTSKTCTSHNYHEILVLLILLNAYPTKVVRDSIVKSTYLALQVLTLHLLTLSTLSESNLLE